MGQHTSLPKQDEVVSKTKPMTEIDKQEFLNISTQLYKHKLLKRCEHIDFDVEAWYNILKRETFYTEFIPIDFSTAQAFINYYQTRYNSKKLFTVNDYKLIQTIQQQLHSKLFHSENNRFQIHGTFIRLSSRSPKDGNPLDDQKFVQLYNKELELLQSKYPTEYDSIQGKANIQLIAYSNAQFQLLKTTNEIEALNFILSSERVFIDLLEAIDCQQVYDNNTLIKINDIKLYDWSTKIIIREWNHLLDPSMEFRCFVYETNLTAISQYNQYCKFYHLQNTLTIENIKTTIIKYWQQKIKPLLDSFKEKYSNYVIDLGLIENTLSKELECVVIELNPFANSTGASLFNWNTDFQQLTGQRDDIEIRIQSNYLSNIEEYVDVIFRQSQLNTENTSIFNNNDDHEPYFIFLNKMKN